MSDIDKRLDEILENILHDYGMNLREYSNGVWGHHNDYREQTDATKQVIKQLMIDEFDKLIGKDEGYDYVKEENSGYILHIHKGRKLTEIEINKNEFRQELRQKLEEWKKLKTT